MNTWQEYALTIIVQVTAISLASVTLMAISHRNAVYRHLLGLLGLVLILFIPLLTLQMPRSTWWRPSAQKSQSQLSANSQAARINHHVEIPSTRETIEVNPLIEGSIRPPLIEVNPEIDPKIVINPVDKSRHFEPNVAAANSLEPPRSGSFWTLRLAGYLWTGGILVFAVIWLWQIRRMRQFMSSFQVEKNIVDEHPEVLREVAPLVCSAVGLHKLPPIAALKEIPMPFVAGVRRPVIVIPIALLQPGSERRLCEVLIHECAHVARHDVWVNLAQRLVGIFWWWHPGIHLMNRITTRSREEVCDNYVLAQGDAAHYAQTLLEIAEACTRASRLDFSLGLLEFHWSLEDRITEFLKPERKMMTRTSRRFFATLIVMFSAMCLSIGGVRAIEGENFGDKTSKVDVRQESPVEKRIQQQLKSITEESFTDIPLKEALEFLGKQHHIKISVDEKALSDKDISIDQSVTLVISGVTLKSVLRLLLEPLTLTYVIKDDALKITTQAAAEKEDPTRVDPFADSEANGSKKRRERPLQQVTVRGQCLDEESKPLANVRVIVLRRSEDYQHESIAGETISNADGNFELANVETAMLDQGDLSIVAALKGHASGIVVLPNPEQGAIVKDVELDSNPGTLSGIVSDQNGKPIPGVTVSMPSLANEPIAGIRSAVTDEKGRYSISDLKRWKAETIEDPETGIAQPLAYSMFVLQHADFPNTMAKNSAIPQEVNVTLYPPAIIEGVVYDAVTKQPAADVTVDSQGVAHHGWYQTKTDAQGRYRLKMVRDHYNIWAEMDGRIPIAIKAIKAERGVTVPNADIQLVNGGFVVGTVYGADGKPISPTKLQPSWVAHYGPARPRTGAAVALTLVEADGTYRLRVAPGQNYVYSMNGPGTSGYVEVKEGEEVTFDIHLGQRVAYQSESADEILGRKIREAAEQEDAADASGPKVRTLPKKVSTKQEPRQRSTTPAGKLLQRLAEQNSGRDLFHDVWCQTMKDIVDMGPVAVPDLIAELDSTNDNMMLRCLGFMLRAIGDKRATPALIRAIPKTLLPPGSDMGLKADNPKIAAFMQKHDLEPGPADGLNYGFGRPVREIFGAIHKLTGNSFEEEQLFNIFAGGTDQQDQLKRDIFARTADEWAKWWEKHWSEYVRDEAYSKVNLPELVSSAQSAVTVPQERLRTNGGGGNWILQPYTNLKGRNIFFDLDTGRVSNLPERWRKLDKIDAYRVEIEDWAMKQGFDLMGTEYVAPNGERRYYAFRPLGLQAWELDKKYWKLNVANVLFEDLKTNGILASDFLLHYDSTENRIKPEETATFLFLTNEGTPGILYVGIEVHDDSLKPGGTGPADNELAPVAFEKGRRFGWYSLEPLTGKSKK